MDQVSLPAGARLFGTEKQTTLLLAIGVMGETYIAELTRLTGLSQAAISKYIDQMEQDGILATRTLGRTREIRLNNRFSAYEELKSLLETLATRRQDLVNAASQIRKRPRKRGKPL